MWFDGNIMALITASLLLLISIIWQVAKMLLLGKIYMGGRGGKQW